MVQTKHKTNMRSCAEVVMVVGLCIFLLSLIITGCGSGKEVTVTSYYAKTYVRSVAFSPDGSRIAAGCTDGAVVVWDIESGKILTQFTEHMKANAQDPGVRSIAFSPDGTRIASASEDETVKVWDVETGEVVTNFTRHTDSVMSVAFSSDGNRIASIDKDKSVKVWEADTGKVIRDYEIPVDVSAVYDTPVVFSPDGTKFVAGYAPVKVWDIDTGKVLTKFTDQSNVFSVTFSPDSSAIASGDGKGTVKIWDVETGKVKAVYNHPEHSVFSVAFSRDGKFIASVLSDSKTDVMNPTSYVMADDKIQIQDIDTGKIIRNIKRDQAVIGLPTPSETFITFSPQGNKIAFLSFDPWVLMLQW